MLSDATLAYAEELTDALLALDALYRAESGDDEGLAVVNMAPGRQPAPLHDYAAAAQVLADLERRAAALPEPDRRRYYAQACQSALAVIAWRSAGLPLDAQVERFLHVPPAPAGDAELDGLRAAMRALLGRMGYHGDLRAQCAAWEARGRVPPDEVAGTLAALLDEAWERTAALIDIPAERSDGMRVRTVRGVPFNARCDYLARQVDLNIDPTLTLPALRHLAAHECYPGHYVQFKLREVWYRQGRAAADGLLSLVNSASSCAFEGLADHGMRLIGWDRGDDDRLQALMTRYRAGVVTGAAWRLHRLGWGAAQVADWLRGQALVGGEGWVANRMGFIAAPQRCALIWSYWWGEPPVAALWDRVAPAGRAELLRYLYGRLHSPDSLALYGAA